MRTVLQARLAQCRLTLIVLDESVFIVAADDRIGEIEIFDDGLQLAGVMLLDFAAKDDVNFIGLSYGAAGVL
jgi:hypothetical protein